MSIFKRLFSKKALIRSLQVFVGIAVVYLAISLGLIYWPAPEPFTDAEVSFDEWQAREIAKGGDHSSDAEFEEERIVARDGTTLFARVFSSDGNTSIILMHGIAASSAIMNNAARLLREATGAEVITPDFRGHGQSGGRAFDVDYIGQYEDDLEDIINFIESQRPEHRIVVAGMSMGGGVAMRYALKEDAPLPDAYLLIAPNFGEGPTQRSGDDMDEDKADEASSFIFFNVRRMIGIIMLNSVGIRALDDLPILYFNYPPQVMEYSYRAVLSAQPIRPNTSDIALQAVQSPLLVVVGSDDEIFEVSNFESFVGDNSDGETVVLPGLTHNGVLNDSATYEVVREWYSRLSP